MHICRLSDLFSEDELEALGDVVQIGLEEAREVLASQEKDPPPPFESQLTSDEVESYVNLMATAKQRVEHLERIADLLERR